MKQKLGYNKLGYKASKAKPIAKGSTHCNPNASLVESNDRIFSRSIIDLSYCFSSTCDLVKNEWCYHF